MTSQKTAGPNPIPRVWVDTDIALGASSGDVDDGFALAALLAAHRLGRLQIVGISSTHGNTTAVSAEKCVCAICQKANVTIAIFRGAELAGRTSAASDALATLEAGVELLCLGPLTNVSAACRSDPTLPARVGLRAVGGNLSSPGFLPPLWPFEFNFARDRDSARFVLSQDWARLTLYPLDVVRRLRIGPVQLQALAGTSPLGFYLAEQSRRWLARARWRHPGGGFPLWDLPAALGAAGALGGIYERRALARGARRLLRSSRVFSCLVSFSPEEAWARLRSLLETAV